MSKIKLNIGQLTFEIEGEDEFVKERLKEFMGYVESSDNLSPILESKNQIEQKEPNSINQDNDKVKRIFGIDKDSLNYIVDIKNDKFQFIISSKELKSSKADMQVRIALIYCGIQELLGIQGDKKGIRQICEDYKCMDANFAANIKTKNYFSMDKSVNGVISLTMPGRDKLKEVVKELVESVN